jgi:DNA-3-methyladenine glycosylase
VTVAARALLGCELRAGPVVVRLTEVEAYAGLGADPASHAHRGPTARNRVMFGPPGQAYLYFVFGMHWCLNVVCAPPGDACAVLLRAGEVTAGLDVVRARRSVRARPVPSGRETLSPPRPMPSGRETLRPVDRELARGPARLVVALGLDGTANDTSLFDGSGPATLTAPTEPVDAALVRAGPRVGVAQGWETPWRFWLAGERSVSPYRRHPRANPDK